MFLLNEQFRLALRHALAWQILLWAIALCGDPRELFLPALTYPSTAFWFGAFLIGCRRPLELTRGDLTFIQGGLPVLVLLGGSVAMGYWCIFCKVTG